ncbi:LysR family transcriptional regulator [Photobacterium leiognathi]|uniref:LysR substrate-binding domain-containing protein n=1 Tax=Photobacterium leiognathi TaxID=553611 RepID=UPI00298133F4|nr:LysR family transcriptional regulator [Photobacterium leiognathi]
MPSRTVLPTTLKKLEVFSEFIKSGSVDIVANSLGINKLSVYRILREVEEDLGFKLFKRNGRRLEPLESASILYESVIQASKSLTDGIAKAKANSGLSDKQLNVGIVNSLSVDLVPYLINSFNQRCKDIDLIFHSDSNDSLINQLENNKLDAILIYGDNAIEKLANMVVLKVIDDTLSFVTSTNSQSKPHASQIPVGLDYLSEQKMLVLKQDFGLRKIYDQLIEQTTQKPTIYSEFSSIFSLSFSLRAGNYGTILPTRLSSIAKQLELNFYPLASDNKYSIYLIFPRAIERTFHMRSLVAACRMYRLKI